jgi:transcriptional regulator with PAS, ATPase and Fis domain
MPDHLVINAFESFPDGLILFDDRLLVRLANPAACALLGYARGQLEGRPYADLFPEGSDIPRDILSFMDPGLVLDSQITTMPGAGGERVSVCARFVIVPLGDDAQAGAVGHGLLCIFLPVHGPRPRPEDRRVTDLAQFGFISRSKALGHIQRVIDDIALSEASVLILGETGTGKELLANTIHSLSQRRGGPMVKVNCGAIPENLLEAELFGYKKGAFTDARCDKPGRFALADGGTIFLDEIGDLPPLLQVKILRVLDSHEFDPLGSTRTEQSDVRIIAATHKDLWDMVERGAFRKDLFFRLNVMSLTIPCLRERQEDIPLLAAHYISSHIRAQLGRPPELSAEVLDILHAHHFPGNIRELHNILEHALVLCKGALITPDHLPAYLLQAVKRSRPGKAQTIEAMEEDLIRTALLEHGRNVERAAASLGIHRTTLCRKIRRLGLVLKSH